MADWSPPEVKSSVDVSGWTPPEVKAQEPATGIEKAGAFARGVAAGTLGGPGDIEYFATTTVPKLFGGEGETGTFMGSPTFFPRSEDVEKGFQQIEGAVGAKPGVRPELEGYRTGGEFAGGFVTPTQIAKTAVAKPIAKGVELFQRAKGVPFEKALSGLTTTAEDIARKTGEKITKREAEEAGKVYTDAQRREINLRDAEKRLTQDAQLAKDESKTALNQIGKPLNEYEVGSRLREKLVVPTKENLDKMTADVAETLKKQYFAEGKASEAAGKFWSQSQTGNEFLKNLKDIASPANSGKYVPAQQFAAQDLLNQLSGKQVGGKIVRSEIEKIENIIRDTKKLPSKPTMTGAEALKQQYMGKLAQMLEDSVYGYADETGKAIEGFAPSGRVFRSVYEQMKRAPNAYESPIGQLITNQVEGVKGIFTADAREIPKAVFKSPQQIDTLEKMGVSIEKMKPYASSYTANELSKFNSSEAIKAWLSSADASYLKKFPEIERKAKDYAKTFEKNEALAARKLESAKAVSETKKGIIESRQAKERDISKLASADRELVNNANYRIQNATTREQAIGESQRYILTLKERGLIDADESSRLLDQVRQVKEQLQDMNAAKTAVKGILPWVGSAAKIAGGGAVAGYSLNKLLGGF